MKSTGAPKLPLIDVEPERYTLLGSYRDEEPSVRYRYTRAEIVRHYATPAEFDRLVAGEEFHPSKACLDWVYRLEATS